MFDNYLVALDYTEFHQTSFSQFPKMENTALLDTLPAFSHKL